MSKIIKAKDVAGIVLGMVKDAILKEYPDATPEERELALFQILGAIARSTDGSV